MKKIKTKRLLNTRLRRKKPKRISLKKLFSRPKANFSDFKE
jgi:hypothetical protein